MKKILVGLSLAAIAVAGAVSAQDAPFQREIEARQGIMIYRALNLGVLGAMAKGEAEYDAAAAQKAADNLLASVTLDQSMLWPQGSDNSVNPDSTALAKIWEADSDMGEMGKAMFEAATAMQAAASFDLDSLKAAMGPVGKACGDCHKAYRVPTN